MGTDARLDKCKHIYEYIGSEICPDCGRYTHETDFQEQIRLHQEWVASGKAKFGGWWSI